jgi:biofilm PGA synthesis N-glycosyltransferase PgaC
VSGELVFYEESDTSIKEEIDFYWNLEKWVRKMESTVHSVAGATGAIYAIRKSLFQMIPDEVLLDDVLIPMNVVFQGCRTVFDGKAVAYDIVSKDMVQEKQRKIRTLAGNWQLISIKPSLLSPLRNPIFFQYLSHKVFRLFVPFFFVTLLVSSLGSVGILYQVSFWGIIGFLLLPFFEKTLKFFPPLIKISKMVRLFISLNYAAVLSFFYFIWPWKKNLW